MSSHLREVVRRVLQEDIAAQRIGSRVIGRSGSGFGDSPQSQEDFELEDFKGAAVMGSSRQPGVYIPAMGDTQELKDFIAAFIPAFKAAFGRDLVVGSTYRSLRSQAEAMRFPIASGDFDRLYSGALGDDLQKVKDLIDAKNYDAAAKILATKPRMRRSHVLGKAVDFSFNRNRLSAADKVKFSQLVDQVSGQIGVEASVNFEKADHFHVNIGGRKAPVNQPQQQPQAAKAQAAAVGAATKSAPADVADTKEKK